MPSLYDRFNLVSDFTLAGDQERAIGELVEGLTRGDKHQVLLGVTGSGKTFTMAHTIAHVNRPTLVMVHNKTLAAQLFQEFRRFFPENAVEYFVSYYDYYQPEAYVPATDSYIEKEATINDEIDRMRLSATRSLFERRDVVIVASVSCIYGLGSPEAYYGMLLPLERGQRISREQVLRKLVEIQYERNDHDFGRGTFRVRGDIIEVYPSYEEQGLRIELFGDEVDELASFDPLTGKTIRRHDKIAVYPKSHFVAPRERTTRAVESIKEELAWYRSKLESEGKLLEAQRLHQRTMLDLEMMREIGYCHGIENYARHINGRAPGEPPPTLLDYLPKGVLVTTLTKRMAEDLTQYYQELSVRVRYLHSDIETLERIEILRDLRRGEFDVLVGINLLREGLDLPEVSLVAILDADKEGFLRSETSLIQTMGRAARNVEGQVVMYADTVTDSMRRAISETQRRRSVQQAYNAEHGIDPQTIRKAVTDILAQIRPDGEAPRPGRDRRSRRRDAVRSDLAELPQ